jgi:hypothetical protein
MKKKVSRQSFQVLHDIVAQFYSGQNIAYLTGKRQHGNSACRNVATLPLVISKPQWVRFADRYFYLREEGLYRFWDWGQVTYPQSGCVPTVVDETKKYSSVILFRNDILSLLRAVAVLCVHGYRQDSLNFKEMVEELKRGSLSISCGTISSFMCKLLNKLGWQARVVSGRRIEGQFNSYDNGHVLFEFYWPKYRKWVLADVDTHQMFLKNGRYLNLAEVSKLINDRENFELKPLTLPITANIDTSDYMENNFPAAACFIPVFSDNDLLKHWLTRTLAVPCHMGQDGKWYYYCENQRACTRIRHSYPSFEFVKKDVWLRQFYGKD